MKFLNLRNAALTATVVFLLLSSASIKAEEVDIPKELKEMMTKAEGLLEKKEYVDFLKLSIHPNMIKEIEKSGNSIEKIADSYKQDSKKPEMLIKLFGILKKSKCELNDDKTTAHFKFDKSLFGENAPPKGTIVFATHEKNWHINEK